MSNNKKAFFFPGQGAQKVGMGRQLLESSEHVRKLFSRASELADTDLEAVVLNGPEECLNSTRLSQPAIFVLSMAVLDELGRLYHNRYDSQVRGVLWKKPSDRRGCRFESRRVFGSRVCGQPRVRGRVANRGCAWSVHAGSL